MGKLIVIEGLDGTGKSTQLELLIKNLKNRGVDCKSFSFPDYESDSSALVKMYLGGGFGDDPGAVNAYAASVFFTVDRYASYKQKWEKYYNDGGIVVVGRYTTSNAVHQTSKLPRDKWREYLDWLYDFEYRLIGIPKPDKVFMLDMPTEVSQKLLSGRYNGDESKKDIHERNLDYLNNCRAAAAFTAEYSGWSVVNCAIGDEPRRIGDIADELLQKTLEIIEK